MEYSSSRNKAIYPSQEKGEMKLKQDQMPES